MTCSMADHEKVNYEKGIDQADTGIEQGYSRKLSLNDRLIFVGSGQTLALGGPAFILVSYIITILIYFIVIAITEVAT